MVNSGHLIICHGDGFSLVFRNLENKNEVKVQVIGPVRCQTRVTGLTDKHSLTHTDTHTHTHTYMLVFMVYGDSP